MSAYVNTGILIAGNPDEITALINVIRFFENKMYEQYQSTHRCAYIKEVRVGNTWGGAYLKDLQPDQKTCVKA